MDIEAECSGECLEDFANLPCRKRSTRGRSPMSDEKERVLTSGRFPATNIENIASQIPDQRVVARHITCCRLRSGRVLPGIVRIVTTPMHRDLRGLRVNVADFESGQFAPPNACGVKNSYDQRIPNSRGWMGERVFRRLGVDERQQASPLISFEPARRRSRKGVK